MKETAITRVPTDTDLQPRVSLGTDAGTDPCEAIRAGAEFPPLTVFLSFVVRHWRVALDTVVIGGGLRRLINFGDAHMVAQGAAQPSTSTVTRLLGVICYAF